MRQRNNRVGMGSPVLVGLLMALVVVLLGSPPASGYEYRVPILVDEEDDLLELRDSEEISWEEYDRLLHILRNPLDLNSASRDELYDLPGVTYALVDRIIERRRDTPFKRVSQLADVEGMTSDVYDQAGSFVRVIKKRKKGDKKVGKLRGEVRARVVKRVSPTDHAIPEAYIRYKMERPGVFKTGMLLLERNVVYWPTFEANEFGDTKYLWKHDSEWNDKLDKAEFEKNGDRVHEVEKHKTHYLLTDRGPIYMTAWPKAYGQWEFDRARFVLGSYNVGFGQRLVFDSTGKSNPHGFLADTSVSESDTGVSPTKGLFGAAATVSPTSWFDFTVFGSWWRYDLYQSDLKHYDDEEDGDDRFESYSILTPYDPDKESEYGNPDIYCDGDCYRKYSYQTLPEAFTEVAAGGNARFSFLGDHHVGLTGYFGYLDFHLGDEDTVFATAATYPQRNMFYSTGVDFALNFNRFSLFGESAIIDTIGEGSIQNDLGFGGLLRGVLEVGDFTLEPLFRYYSEDWDNPHARGSAAPDEWMGNNDRGELGFLLKSRYRPAKWVALRLDLDFWQASVWQSDKARDDREYPWRTDIYLKADFFPIDKLRLGIFLQFADRDVTVTGLDEEYNRSEDTPPRGEKYMGGLQLSTKLIPQLSLLVYYKASLIGAGPENSDGTGDGQLDFEHYAYLKFRFTPFGFKNSKAKRWLVVDARVKYLDGEVIDDAGSSAERFVEEYLQLGTTIAKQYTVTLRGASRQHFEKKNAKGETTKKATEWYWKVGLGYKF